MKSPAPKRKKPALNITVSPDVRAAIEARASRYNTSISALVGALVKVWCELPMLPSEKPIQADLKRILGREQFLAFLGAVRAALPDYAEPLPCPAKPEGEPEAWKLPFGVGVLAFYAPTEANVGLLFSKASAVKTEHRLARVLVVTTHGDVVPAGPRADLAAAGIVVLSLADLPRELAKLTGNRRHKRPE